MQPNLFLENFKNSFKIKQLKKTKLIHQIKDVQLKLSFTSSAKSCSYIKLFTA